VHLLQPRQLLQCNQHSLASAHNPLAGSALPLLQYKRQQATRAARMLLLLLLLALKPQQSRCLQQQEDC
jgi:hypothetical protein